MRGSLRSSFSGARARCRPFRCAAVSSVRVEKVVKRPSPVPYHVQQPSEMAVFPERIPAAPGNLLTPSELSSPRGVQLRRSSPPSCGRPATTSSTPASTCSLAWWGSPTRPRGCSSGGKLLGAGLPRHQLVPAIHGRQCTDRVLAACYGEHSRNCLLAPGPCLGPSTTAVRLLSASRRWAQVLPFS